MEAKASSSLPGDRTFLRGILGGLDAPMAQSVAAAGGDVTIVIDRDGVIRDMAVGTDQMARDGARSWLDRPWSETVTKDSRKKVEELLRDAVTQGRTRWREVNQVTPSLNSLLLKYVAVDTGRDGRVIAIGRDERSVAEMQQRLMAAQQAMERDYSRLRDAEFRYRLLFQTSSEAVIIVDPLTRRIVEANPAAHAITGVDKTPLQGEPFIRMFEPESQDGAASLLTLAQSTSHTDKVQMRLSSHQREFVVTASLFRQDRGSQCLVRLSPADLGQGDQGSAGYAAARLSNVIERIPDAFVVTDDAMRILIVNTAFLQLARLGGEGQALGQPLTRFLGREGLDRNLLLESLRDHGSVRNFTTILRGQYDEQEDVEVSGVAAPDGGGVCYGFTIRRLGRRLADRAQNAPQLRRSVEQLTELVGRVKLKELVRETTDLVERLCIEAALELTKDNRASAADVLGLSRQSLYSKLHRFGLVNSVSTDN
jgi:transcriptional regulator PpsR